MVCRARILDGSKKKTQARTCILENDYEAVNVTT